MTDGRAELYWSLFWESCHQRVVVTHPGMAGSRGMSPRRTSCLHCLSAKRANTAISCVTVKSPLWLHYLGQSAPGPCPAEQDSLQLLACLFLHDSVWVTISSSSQGEQRRNRPQLQVMERGRRRRHGHHPFDTSQAIFRAECPFNCMIVRRNSLALIIKIIHDSLFTRIQLLPFFI